MTDQNKADISDIVISAVRGALSVFSILLFVVVIIGFLASNQPQSVERSEVVAVITEVRHRSAVPAGKVIIPAKYIVYFEYCGFTGQWYTNSENYEYYKNKVGDNINCFLIVETFSDGEVKKELTVIGDD